MEEKYLWEFYVRHGKESKWEDCYKDGTSEPVTKEIALRLCMI